MALVTIILTTLNSEKFVSQSIRSCLNQSYSELELLIVDGGSDDRTLNIIDEFQDDRIRVIHQVDNTGKLPGAINLGMQNALGEFITWTQDDCWYELNAIEILVSYLQEHPEIGLVYADYWDVDETGQPIKYQAVHPPEDILMDDVIRVCFLLKREVYENIGPQEIKYFPVHEVPWRIKIAAKFKIAPIHTPLMFYIVREESLTGRFGERNLRQITCKILLDEGYIDSKKYKQLLSQADMHQAFDEFIVNGDFKNYWKYNISAIWLDYRWLTNKGIIKFMLYSLPPWRNRFRKQLLDMKIIELNQENSVINS